MTSVRSTNMEDIGQTFAGMVRPDAAVRRLYAQMSEDGVQLWLLTDSIDSDHELGLYQLAVILDQEFPGFPIEFHLVNPSHFEPFNLRQLIPFDDPGVTLLYEA